MRELRRDTGTPKGPGQVVVDLAAIMAVVVLHHQHADFLLKLAVIVRDGIMAVTGGR